MTPLLGRRGPALAAALFCCLLWGSAFPTVKAGLRWLTPTFFAGARFTIAGAAVLVLAAAVRRGPPGWSGHARGILLVGFFQTFVGYYFFFHGLQKSSAVTGSIINSAGVFMTAVLAWLLLGEGGWSAGQAAGVAIGFAGVVLATAGPDWRPSLSAGGEGLILLSALSLAYSSILVKRMAAATDAMLISGGSMVSGGMMLLVLAALTEPVGAQSWSEAAIALLLWSAFISAAAFTVWYALLRHNDVSTISTAKFTIPIFGSVLSAATLGEELTAAKVAGGLLVGLGMFLIFRHRAPAAQGSFPG